MLLEWDGGWREHRQGISGLPSGRLRTIMGLESTLGKMKTEVCVKGKPVMSFISHALMWGIEIITSRRIIALGTVGTREAARC